MMGLNVTSKCAVDLEVAAPYIEKAPQILKDAVKTMIAFRAGEALHDAVAVGLMVRPQMGKFEDYYVQIETSSPLTKGQTVVDFANTTGKKANVSVAMDIDSDIRVMENMLRRDTASVEDDFGLGGAAVQRAPDEE